MLGKNGWRLITNNLVARIYKVRYYPTIEFLNAKLGNKPSFLWRSLLAAQSLIRHGTRWRVGSGHQVNIWTEPWLPNDESPWVQSPRLPEVEETTVQNLLVPGEHAWDMDILQVIFLDRNRSFILQLLLSHNIQEDRLYRRHELKGSYTIKSAYCISPPTYLPST